MLNTETQRHDLRDNDPGNTPSLNWAALIETGLLGGTAAVMLTKALRGVLVFYIHPRYAPLVVISGIVLLLIAGIRMRSIYGPREPLTTQRFGYLLLLLPILLGTFVPARPLGASALTGDTLGADITTAALDLPDPEDDTTTWNLMQWATALSVRSTDELTGKPADVIGFVYHDPERPLDGFLVVRYVVTCCSADGNGTGLPVVWKGGATLPQDSWVRVRATLGTTIINDSPEPALIATSVEPVERPDPPYLYP